MIQSPQDPHETIQKIIQSLPESEKEQVLKAVKSGDQKLIRSLYKNLLKLFLEKPELQDGILSQAEEISTKEFKYLSFTEISSPDKKRQVLRWLIYDQHKPNQTILNTLLSALDDQDWEVRITAILVAGRMRISSLSQAISQVKLPRTSKYGFGQEGQALLRALRDFVLKLLSGKEPIPPDNQKMPFDKATMGTHLMRLVAGESVQWHDRAFLKVHALTTPSNPEENYNFPSLPKGLSEENGRFYTQRARIEFIPVPATSHWLGADEGELGKFGPKAISNPIRKYNPEKGFWIAKDAFTLRQGSGLIAPDSDSCPNEKYLICKIQIAREICLDFSEMERMSFRLPSADECEMLARGTDGRRMPWGNGIEKSGPKSPWGGVAMLGKVPQWTGDKDENEHAVICGGTDWSHSGLRMAESNPKAKAGFRFVISSD